MPVAGDELGRVLPLQPLLDAVDELVRHAGSGGADQVVGPDIAILGPLIGGQTEPAGAAALAALTDPDAGQALLFAALFSALRRQAEREPLVLVIDDVHLADTATTRWLSQVVRRLADSRVAVIAARRAEEGVPVPGVTTIALGPLDLDAAVAIVGPERAAPLHNRSAGHPLFLVELAAADGELPISIRRAVEDRCARSVAAAATLRAAAVIGPEIDLDLLAAATDTTPGELLDLASGRLLTGDLDAAGKLLNAATALGEVEHAFRWRHPLRSRLVRARLDLARGDAEAALTSAESLAADAATLGAPRYQRQARLVAATAAHRAGGVVDLDEIGRLLLRLDEVAGLEAWWITGEVAAAFGVSAWEDLARRRVGELRTRAGDYTGALEREAGRRLGWR